MNVRLKKKFGFSSGLVFDGQFLLNQYLVSLTMVTATDDHREQNVAYERVKYWMNEILDSAVLIPITSDRLTAYMATGQRLITVPEEPVDQIIGIMLYSKLNAITEGRLIVTDVEISSIHGDNMIYLHNEDENLGPFAHDGWWQDARPKCANLGQFSITNVIELVKPPEWKDVGLDWKETEESTNTVVFADFKKDETE